MGFLILKLTNRAWIFTDNWQISTPKCTDNLQIPEVFYWQVTLKLFIQTLEEDRPFAVNSHVTLNASKGPLLSKRSPPTFLEYVFSTRIAFGALGWNYILPEKQKKLLNTEPENHNLLETCSHHTFLWFHATEYSLFPSKNFSWINHASFLICSKKLTG